MSNILLTSGSTPSIPASGKVKVFADSSDSHLKQIDDTGTVTDLTTGAGGTDANAIHDNVSAEISAIAGKTTPVDADVAIIEDSESSYAKKSLTWSNIKATLKTYFDTVYAAITHTHTASDITDFDAGVSNNPDVVANTAKVTNATHTGDVTGDTVLTIAAGVVDIDNLSATGTADSTTFLRGDNTWATAVLGGAAARVTTDQTISYGNTDKVSFDTEVFDKNSEFDPTTSRFTAGRAGALVISGTLEVRNVSGYGSTANIYLYKNGVQERLQQFTIQNSMHKNIAFCFPVSASSGDYYEIYFYAVDQDLTLNYNGESAIVFSWLY